MPIRHPWLETPSIPAAFAAALMRSLLWPGLKPNNGAES